MLLGTSSFTASGWAGSFYPKGMRPADYLSFYAEHFPAVEVDSTFYACPSVQTVRNWAARTPEGFTFAVKIPQAISHEKVLVGCDAELNLPSFWTALFHSSRSSRIRTNSRLRFAIETGLTRNLRACSGTAALRSYSRIVPGCQVLPNLSSIRLRPGGRTSAGSVIAKQSNSKP